MRDSTESLILESRVRDADRLQFLQRHFGSHMLTFERSVYIQFGYLCADYQGGFWDYFELSNGGCYPAPAGAREFMIRVEGNGYSGRLDSKAAGIVVTLFSLSRLSFRHPEFERFAERFHQLREFALERPDAGEILAAID